MTLGEMIAKKVRVAKPTEQQTQHSPAARKLRETLRSKRYIAEKDPQLERFEKKLKA